MGNVNGEDKGIWERSFFVLLWVFISYFYVVNIVSNNFIW